MSEKTANKFAKPSPRNGNALPVGAHEGNTGGKKGRSGRKTNEFRAAAVALRDERAVELIRETIESQGATIDGIIWLLRTSMT